LQELADRAALAVANAQLVRRLQEELAARRDAEAKYRTLVEQIPAITYIAAADRVGQTLYISPQIEGTLGFTPEEWTSAPNFWTTRLHPDDRDRVIEQDEQTRRARAPFEVEYRLLARDGSVHWIRDQAAMVLDAADEPLYQHGIMLDITPSKLLESRLTRALEQAGAVSAGGRQNGEDRGAPSLPERIAATLLDPAPVRAFFGETVDRLFGLAEDGTVCSVNDSLVREFGFEPREVLGMHYSRFVHRDDLALVEQRIALLLEHPEQLTRFPLLRIRTQGGEWRWTEGVAVNRLSDPDVRALLFNVRDMTEIALREDARLQTESAEREQRAFAGALRDAAALLNSTSDVEQALDGILDTVARIVPYETASIFMREGNLLRMARARGFERYGLDRWIGQLSFSTDIPKYQRLAQDPTPLVISDTQADPQWIELRETEWIRSHVAVPVRISDETVGMLGLDSATPNFYTAEHGARLLSFADLAGAAIHNARLLQETRRRAQEFRALYETVSELNTPVETMPKLEKVVARAMELLKAPVGFLYIHHPLEQSLELVVSYGLDASAIATLGYGEGLAGRVAVLREPMAVSDYQTWEYRAPQRVRADTRAALAVPILYGGHLSGVLGVAETDPDRQFDDKQLSLMTLFAGQVGAALETARLLTETRQRAEQLSLLYDVGLTLNRVLDSHTQLQFLFKIARRALRSDTMTYFRYDSASGSIAYEMGVGVAEEGSERLRASSLPVSERAGVVGWVALHRLPVSIPDVSRDARRVELDERTRSALAVPVEHETELRGVLMATRASGDAFTPQDERLLILFANQIAAAMELTQLFEAQTQRQHELEILRQASLAFAATPEPEALTTLILDCALRLVAADNALIFFFADDRLTFGALLWSRQSVAVPTHWTPRRDGFTYTVARSGKTHVIDKVNVHPLFADWQWGGAIIGLPLKGGGRVRAVLNVAYETPHRFTPEEIRVLELLADQAAVALENARNFEETQRQLRDAQILHRAGEALNRTLSLPETLEQLADFFMEAFAVQACCMTRFHRGRDEIEILLDRDPMPDSAGAPGTTYRVSDYPHLVRVMRDNTAYAIRRDAPDLLPQDAQTMDRFHWKSLLALPLLMGEQVIGFVELADQQVCRDFSPEELYLCESLAHLAARALENARLFQETERRAEHLTVLNHIARRANSASTLDEMLTLIESEIATVLPSDGSFIALYDAASDKVDFHRVVEYGAPQPPFQWQLGPSLTRQVIRSARALRLDDLAEYSSVENPPQYYGDGTMLRAWLGVPIRSGDCVLGVISLQSKARAAFGEADEQLLQTIADQVAAALERVRRAN
jgi:PAS domain S-box-containing protein